MGPEIDECYAGETTTEKQGDRILPQPGRNEEEQARHGQKPEPFSDRNESKTQR